MSNVVQEVKMQELRDLFFYTFGILPLQNYNVIGNGITDNRQQIQQAIYDALEIGAKYIFVPTGEYYYSNNLFRASEVIFVGNNARAKIKDIDIRPFPDLWSEAQATSPIITPIAGIIVYAGKGDIPGNYLECNGQTLNTQEYLDLYVKLNDIKDIETIELPETFTLPNLSTGNDNTKYIIRTK